MGKHIRKQSRGNVYNKTTMGGYIFSKPTFKEKNMYQKTTFGGIYTTNNLICIRKQTLGNIYQKTYTLYTTNTIYYNIFQIQPLGETYIRKPHLGEYISEYSIWGNTYYKQPLGGYIF